MANDLLIAAIRNIGLDPEDISGIAGVDPRTAQRWLGGRVPHPRYRQILADALHTEENELWPETGRRRGKDDLSEIVGAWAQRSHPSAPDWRALTHQAERQIDMLGYSLLHVAEARGINKLLAAKARDGCHIRIALADPGTDHVATADRQQRPPGKLTTRIHNSRERLTPLAMEPGIELRQHQTASSHTILRFDEHTLLTIHLHGTPGFQAPLLHLQHDHDYGLFDQLAKHFEDIWQTAQPIGDHQPHDTAQPPTTAAGGDDILDRLDYVWRPNR